MVISHIYPTDSRSKYITRSGRPIARIEPQGRMKRVTLLDGTFYTVCSRGRYMASGKHPCDVVVHPDYHPFGIRTKCYRWFNRIKAFWA